MKEFNLLKEEHGIRARLKELNSSDERRIDTGFIFIALLFITVAVLSYAVYSMSNLGITAKTDRHIPDSKSFRPEAPATDFQKSILNQVQDKSENPPSPPLAKGEDKSKFADEPVINEGLGEVISGVPPPHLDRKTLYPEAIKNEQPSTNISEHSKQGVGAKKEEVVKKKEKWFSIRVATCVLRESADAVQRDLKDKGFSSYIKTAQGSVKGKATNLYKVYTGDYNSREKASATADKLKAKGFSAIIEETPTLPSSTGGEGKREGGY